MRFKVVQFNTDARKICLILTWLPDLLLFEPGWKTLVLQNLPIACPIGDHFGLLDAFDNWSLYWLKLTDLALIFGRFVFLRAIFFDSFLNVQILHTVTIVLSKLITHRIEGTEPLIQQMRLLIIWQSILDRNLTVTVVSRIQRNSRLASFKNVGKLLKGHFRFFLCDRALS